MIHHQDATVTLHHGDALDVLATLPDAAIDAVVCDPPYGLEFMGKGWDSFGRDTGSGYREKPRITDRPDAVSGYNAGGKGVNSFQAGRPFQAWCELWLTECLRVLKPGGHCLAFGGTRTWHRLVCATEDAGFEIRDSIAWLYGSGFPKSLDVGKAIDKARDDRWEEVLPVTRAIRQALVDKGVTRRDMNRACGLGDSDAGSAQSWVTATADGAHKPRVPTVEQWTILRDLLGLQHLDGEVWRLNGRKGTPGEAWTRREVVGKSPHSAQRTAAGWLGAMETPEGERLLTAPATDAARQWQGWGTALKPGHEPIMVARKPLAGTVAATVLAYGTGALNIDATRIGTSDHLGRPQGTMPQPMDWGNRSSDGAYVTEGNPAGRWPANVVLDGDAADTLDQMSGELTSGANPTRRNSDKFRNAYGDFTGQEECTPARGADSGGASRFFLRVPIDNLEHRYYYTAKAGTDERITSNGVSHPTVKPLALMRWLVRLVTPHGGTVLDPFAGSGTTVEACILEGFHCIAIEKGGPPGTPEAEYLNMITQRIHRRRDPIAYITAAGQDLGLFGLDGEL